MFFFLNLKKQRVNSRNNAVVRRRGLIYGTVLSVIRILPGGLESLLAAPPPGVLRTQEEDRKPLWVDDMPLLCAGGDFNSSHVMTCPSCRGNEVNPGWGNVGLESNGRAKAESSER